MTELAHRPGRCLRRPPVHRQSGRGDAARRLAARRRFSRRSRWRTISRDRLHDSRDGRRGGLRAALVHAGGRGRAVRPRHARQRPCPDRRRARSASAPARRASSKWRATAMAMPCRCPAWAPGAKALARGASRRSAATPVETLWHAQPLRASSCWQARPRCARSSPISARSPRRATSSPSSPRPATDTDIVSRVFAPGAGIDEDPVTGSAHAVLTPYWAERLGRTAIHRLPGEQARRPSHLPPRRRPRHPRRQMRDRDRRSDADLVASPRPRNCSPQISRRGIPFSAFSVKNRNGCGEGAGNVEHPDRRGRTFVRPDAQTSGRIEPALQRHRRRRGQRIGALAAVAERRPDLALVDLQLAHGIDRLRGRGRSCTISAFPACSPPARRRFPDARSRARLPGQAVQRGRSGPRAQGRRGHDARPPAALRPSRPGNLRLYAEEAAPPPRPRPPALLPTPDRSSARRTPARPAPAASGAPPSATLSVSAAAPSAPAPPRSMRRSGSRARRAAPSRCAAPRRGSGGCRSARPAPLRRGARSSRIFSRPIM